jgi:hypothetical protein
MAWKRTKLVCQTSCRNGPSYGYDNLTLPGISKGRSAFSGAEGEGRAVPDSEKPVVSETPLAWFNLAHAYLYDAATLHNAQKPSGGFYDHPERFLYFHSVELFLKAFLRLHGIEDEDLGRRPYSHNLTNLADEAERRGLLITRRVRLVCEAAGVYDKPTEARYVRTGRKTILPPHKLHEAARELQSRVGQALRDNGIKVRQPPNPPIIHTRRPLTLAKAAKLLARRDAKSS